MNSSAFGLHRLLRILPAALMLLAAGCGFHLRATLPVAPALQPLALKCASRVPDELCHSLGEQLELAGVLVRDASGADYLLTLDDFRQERRTTAVTAEGSAAEYRLSQSLRISLKTADGVPLITDAELVVRESYGYDDTTVLAKEEEQAELEQLLHERLARQVLFRLAPMTDARIQELRQAYDTP